MAVSTPAPSPVSLSHAQPPRCSMRINIVSASRKIYNQYHFSFSPLSLYFSVVHSTTKAIQKFFSLNAIIFFSLSLDITQHFFLFTKKSPKRNQTTAKRSIAGLVSAVSIRMRRKERKEHKRTLEDRSWTVELLCMFFFYLFYFFGAFCAVSLLVNSHIPFVLRDRGTIEM